MKIVFMGTPEFAVPSLQALVDAGHDVGIVVTKPDTMRDRGKKIKFPEIKTKAFELGIDVLQPEKIKENEAFKTVLKEYAPDLLVTAAYGKIVPSDILEIPAKGALNVHASLLPKFRGAAPIQHAILAGEEKTGVTIMMMAEKLDAGDILAQVATPIEKKTSEDLHDELAAKGAKLLVETAAAIERGDVKCVKQDEAKVSFAPMISKKDGAINFGESAAKIERKVRAFYPWPGAYTYCGGKLFKVWEAEVAGEGKSDAEPGTVTGVSKEGIDIACGEGILRLKTVQIAGKKRMKTEDFLRGHSVEKMSKMG